VQTNMSKHQVTHVANLAQSDNWSKHNSLTPVKLGYKFIVTGQQNLVAFNVRCLSSGAPVTVHQTALGPFSQICCNKVCEGSNTKSFSCKHSPIL